MLVLNRSEVTSLVKMHEAVECAAKALAAHSAEKTEIPLRTALKSPKGVSLFMPGAVPGQGALGIKVLSVFEDNPEKGLPTITAAMLLLDMATGAPLACMEAGSVTALRTGAAAGVATDYLARRDSDTVLVIGAGVQARTQLEAVCAVRKIKRAVVYDLDRCAASEFRNEMSAALDLEISAVFDPNSMVAEADVIICATTSKTPVFDGSLVRPGTHINGVGSYRPDMQELDETIVGRADRFVCDSAGAAWEEAGDLLVALKKSLIGRDRVDAEVGDLLLGRSPGRLNSDEITIYKAVGLAVLDLALARFVFRRAQAERIGTYVDLMA